MNAFFNKICRASVAKEQANWWERSLLKEMSCIKMKSMRKKMKLRGKPGQNNPPKGFEEE